MMAPCDNTIVVANIEEKPLAELILKLGTVSQLVLEPPGKRLFF